ncbi:phosphoadenosine phosphosulfate reductase family protein, partial [Akkermansiaceae bacterium]|nr:phosphoadenosine phosphosulfate reductase family protein [Akkermansiaceae bacterium]
SVQDSIDKGTAVEETGANASRNKLQTVTLLETIEEQQYDAVLGGGRRDEEKARAKERFFSHRNDFGEWDPKNQRPELWNLFNQESTLGSSPCPTLPRWTFGCICIVKESNCQASTMPMSAKQ